jgi:hypothetical protein
MIWWSGLVSGGSSDVRHNYKFAFHLELKPPRV